MNRFLPTTLITSLFLLLGLLVFNVINHSSEVWFLEKIKLTPPSDSSIPIHLGYKELGQYKGNKSADAEHLKLRFDEKKDSWMLSNVALKKKIAATSYQGQKFLLKRWELQTGDQIKINNVIMKVTSVDIKDETLTLEAKSKSSKITTSVVWKDDELLHKISPEAKSKLLKKTTSVVWKDNEWLYKTSPICRDNTLFKQFTSLFKPPTSFTLGDGLKCKSHWDLPLPDDSAKIIWQDGKAWLSPLRNDVFFNFKRDNKSNFIGIKALETAVIGNKGSETAIIGKKDLDDLVSHNGQKIIGKLVIGHTHYQLALGDDKSLRLIANEKIHFFTEKPKDNQATSHWTKMSWIGATPPNSSLFKFNRYFIGVFIFLLLLAYVFSAWVKSEQAYSNVTTNLSHPRLFAALLIPILSFTLTFSMEHQHLAMCLLLVSISWLWLYYLLWCNQHLQGISGWFFLLLLFIVGISLITQTQLTAGALNSRWLNFSQGYLWFLLAITIPFSAIAIMPRSIMKEGWEGITVDTGKVINTIYFLLVFILSAFLIKQVLSGSEGGLGFFQPVEFIKLLFVILLAKVTLDLNEVRMMNIKLDSSWLWYFSKGLLLTLTAAILAVLAVRDFSPFLIILTLLLAYFWLIIRHPVKSNKPFIWKTRSAVITFVILVSLLALLFIYYNPNSWVKAHFGVVAFVISIILFALLLIDCNPNSWVKARSGVVVFIMLIILFALFIYYNPNSSVLDFIPQGERFKIWANPWAYPDAGRQLQQSLQHVHDGGWLGTGWFGANGETIMNLAAIQDDFILAFLLYKFGGILGLFLLFLQMTWLGLQFWLFKQLFKTMPIPREEQLSQTLLAYILYGLLWMQLIHWMISWGNVLGLMPIMGQPMIWLSSGKSYLLAIALPSALLTFVAIRLLDKRNR